MQNVMKICTANRRNGKPARGFSSSLVAHVMQQEQRASSACAQYAVRAILNTQVCLILGVCRYGDAAYNYSLPYSSSV